MTRASRAGAVTIDGDHATISFERRLRHPITAVWAAITDPRHRAAWFGPTTLDPREGGMLEMVAEGPPAPAEMRRMSGRILVWDPPHVFEHEWRQKIVGDTVVRYELVADGDTTILRFSHSRLRTRDARGYIPGEHAFLDRLEAHLDGEELPSWTARYGEVQGAYA